MMACPVCHATKSKAELVRKIFEFDNEYVLVEAIPATVCQSCGERTFSGETVEHTRRIIENGVARARTVPLQVYDYA